MPPNRCRYAQSLSSKLASSRYECLRFSLSRKQTEKWTLTWRRCRQARRRWRRWRRRSPRREPGLLLCCLLLCCLLLFCCYGECAVARPGAAWDAGRALRRAGAVSDERPRRFPLRRLACCARWRHAACAAVTTCATCAVWLVRRPAAANTVHFVCVFLLCMYIFVYVLHKCFVSYWQSLVGGRGRRRRRPAAQQWPAR
jgi:hypothetical protein